MVLVILDNVALIVIDEMSPGSQVRKILGCLNGGKWNLL